MAETSQPQPDQGNQDAQLKLFRAGQDVSNPPTFQRPEIDLSAPRWDLYYGPQFRVSGRVLLTLIITGPLALLVGWALIEILFGEGRQRAAGFIPLMPAVPMAALVAWAWRDMWFPRRR